MKKLLGTLLLFILTFSSMIDGSTITPISKIEEARASLENANEDTLVIFDVDRTLVLMGDQLLNSGKSGFKKKMMTYPAYTILNEEEKDTLLSIVLLKTSHEIIEKDSVAFIHELQSRNIKTIVCTTLETGHFGRIPSMEQWRVDSLKHLGLNFSGAFPEHPEIRFFPQETDRFPVFKDGALIASKRTKGEVVKLFLEKLEWRPRKIIMIDDQLSALDTVEKEIEEFGIAFEGFHYTYVSDMIDSQVLDDSLVDFQLSYLLENNVWLTDKEAEILMTQGKIDAQTVYTTEEVESFFTLKRQNYEPIDDETIFIIVRHGENLSNVARTYDGRTLNLPLTPKGHLQGEIAGKNISTKVNSFDVVITNSMGRTVETATEILKAFPDGAFEYQSDDRFLERYVGRYEGGYIKDYDPINKLEKEFSSSPLHTFQEKMSYIPEEGIESYADIWRRSHNALQQLHAQHKGKVVLVVTHNGTIRSIYWHLAHQLGFFVPYANFKPDNGAYVIISGKNGAFTLLESHAININESTD